MADRYYQAQLTDLALVCTGLAGCGCLVHDLPTHEAWHLRVEAQQAAGKRGHA